MSASRTTSYFFRNNNSILVPVTSYVHDAAINPSTSASSSPPPAHFVDAYCGAGVFALTPRPTLRTSCRIGLSA
ncbi:hypothetical protein BC826DRAFT_1035490, partial [Russula brevipes]